MRTYLGIDCGSVSVKFALMRDRELIGKVYLKNRGLIETIQGDLGQLPRVKRVKIEGVGITGSGKEFVKALVGADYADSEIISHLVACLQEYPTVRTVLDIGGEDSKLLQIRNGTLVNFQMNKDCGGGTGAMIEAIAFSHITMLPDGFYWAV